MADADGRFNSERDGRRRAMRSTRDPRSAERARRAPRRSASSSRRSPVSVIETGEQEIHRDDVDEIGADASPVDTTSDDAARRASSRGSRTPRRRPTFADSVTARVRGLDAKRAVIMALVIGVVAIALAPSLRNYYQGRSEYNQVVASNEQLRNQMTYYQKKVNEQGDPAYKEAQARERLGMVRPGETGLVMMYPGDADKQAAEQAAQKHAANPWYSNLWESVATPPDGR